jgi:hypothetical protein
MVSDGRAEAIDRVGQALIGLDGIGRATHSANRPSSCRPSAQTLDHHLVMVLLSERT